MASNQGNDQGFPLKISPPDLQDSTLTRLNRCFQIVWTAINEFRGDSNPGHFLSGTGAYTNPLVSTFPAKHDSPGTPGAAAYDSGGNFYFCYAMNSWAQIGPAGYSNTF